MATLAKLMVELDLNPAGLERGIKRARADLSGLDQTAAKSVGTFGKLKGALGSVFGKAAGFAGGILLANTVYKITGAIGGLISASLDFDEAMRNVNSVAQLSEKQFGALTDSVLQLAEDPRILDTPAMLARGLYDIVSSGFKAADAMKILEAAAVAATAGMTTTAVASDVLTGTLMAYHLSAEKATEVSNSLFEIVNLSKVTFEQLATSLSYVTPAAATLGVSLNELGAGMATLTNNNIDAGTAAIELNGILTGLLKPTDALTQLLNDNGYASGEALLKAKGFAGALQFLTAAIGGSGDKAAQLFGDVRALRAIMILAGDGGKMYADNLKLMGTAQDGAGATAKALAEQMKSARFQLRLLDKNVVLFFTEGIGGKFTSQLAKAISWINHFFDSLFRARRRGLGLFDAALVALRSTIYKVFGRQGLQAAQPYLDAFLGTLRVIGGVAKVVAAGVKFLAHHLWLLRDAFFVATLGPIGLLLHFKPVRQAVWFLIKTFFALFATIGKVAGWFRLFRSKGLNPVSAALRAFGTMLEHFKSTWAPLQKIVRDVGHAIAYFAQAIHDFLSGNPDKGIKHLADSFFFLLDALKTAFRAVPWKQIGAAILKGIRSLFEAIPWRTIGLLLLAGGQILISLLWQGMTSLWTGTVAPWLTGLAAQAAAWILGKLQDLSDAGSSLIQGAYDGMVIVWGGVVRPWLHDRIDAIATALGDWYSAAYGWGSSLVNGIWDSITSAWSRVTSWLSNNMSPGAIAGYLGDWYSAAYGWGQSLVSGIANGIASGIGWVGDQIQAIEDKILGLWNFLQHPHSPSKLTMEWGRSIPLGLSAGIGKELPGVARQMAAVNATVARMGAGGSSPSLAVRPVPPVAATGGGITSGGMRGPVSITVNVNGANMTNEEVGEIASRMILSKLRTVQAGAA